MESLFDVEVSRSGGPARRVESRFAFLNRSDRPAFSRVRDELEIWFAAYPEGDDKRNLRQRFRSAKTDQHVGAWAELYFHRLFTVLGFELEPHPELSSSTAHPDFRVSRGGRSFLVEVTSIRSGIVREDDRHEARENEMLDLIDSVEHPLFGVTVEIGNVGASMPKRGPILRRLQDWLAGLPVEDPRWDDPSFDPDPFVIDVDDWDVRLFPSRHTDWRDPQPEPYDRLILGGPVIAGMVDDSTKLRNALDAKRSKYGVTDEPYVIAVMCDSFGIGDDDALDALLGHKALSYVIGDRSRRAWVRNNDGVFLRGATPSANHVSAVVIAHRSSPWNVAAELPTVWVNPWAARPLGDVGLPTATITSADAVDHTEIGTSAASVFGLPDGWPGFD